MPSVEADEAARHAHAAGALSSMGTVGRSVDAAEAPIRWAEQGVADGPPTIRQRRGV